MRAKSAKELKAKWEACSWHRKRDDPRGDLPDSRVGLNPRLRRALSWLERAEKENTVDLDAAFIFYWIAFNAMYGQQRTSREPSEDYVHRREYLGRILECSGARSVIYDAVWSVLRDEIDKVWENQFVYDPYWENRHDPNKAMDWKGRFNQARGELKEAMQDPRQIRRVLDELFNRLNTLRKQLIHGGATWKGPVNRNQVESGARIMKSLVPHFIEVMLDHPDDWGTPHYPAVKEDAPRSGWQPDPSATQSSRGRLPGIVGARPRLVRPGPARPPRGQNRT